MTIRFDDSLPTFVCMLDRELGRDAVAKAVIVRDATGYLSVVVDGLLSDEMATLLNEKARACLGAYAREEDCIRDRNGVGASRVLNSPSLVRILTADIPIRLLDRRMVGADWLLPPRTADAVPRIAFASIKGGVGRSTALAVMANYLSSRGLRVLAVDLDLEAPGIGSMLIEPDLLPRFGTLDYLVENGISGIDPDFVANATAHSSLGSMGGRVTVMPAFGTETIKNPAAALGKISRAYIEDIQDGLAISLTDQVRAMVKKLEDTGEYDVVLVDGRAGLHETTAAVVLGLGAEVLFFGIDETQTFMGYKLLLAHIASYAGDEYISWRDRIQFVHAKASADPNVQANAAARFRELITAYDPKKPDDGAYFNDDRLTADDFDVEWSDTKEDVLSDISDNDDRILKILNDSNYFEFNPINKPDLLASNLFKVTFGDLLAWTDGVLGIGDQE